MPSRMLRESICYSETLAALSPEAERLFYRLMTQADDFGRFDARPCVVRSRCFQLGGVSDEKVASWLAALCDQRVICLYDVEGKEYGHFPTWGKYQRIRSPRSRYPDPPHDAAGCGELPQDAAECGSRARASGSGSRTRTKISNSNSSNGASLAALARARDDEFEEFWKLYPRKVGKKAARVSWEKLHPPLEKVRETLRWETQSDRWREEGGRFIPHPATWLNQGRWDDEPPPDPMAAMVARLQQQLGKERR